MQRANEREATTHHRGTLQVQLSSNGEYQEFCGTLNTVLLNAEQAGWMGRPDGERRFIERWAGRMVNAVLLNAGTVGW